MHPLMVQLCEAPFRQLVDAVVNPMHKVLKADDGPF